MKQRFHWFCKCKGPFTPKDDNYKDNDKDKDIVLKIVLIIKE